MFQNRLFSPQIKNHTVARMLLKIIKEPKADALFATNYLTNPRLAARG